VAKNIIVIKLLQIFNKFVIKIHLKIRINFLISIIKFKKKGTKYETIFKNYINTIPNTRY